MPGSGSSLNGGTLTILSVNQPVHCEAGGSDLFRNLFKLASADVISERRQLGRKSRFPFSTQFINFLLTRDLVFTLNGTALHIDRTMSLWLWELQVPPDESTSRWRHTIDALRPRLELQEPALLPCNCCKSKHLKLDFVMRCSELNFIKVDTVRLNVFILLGAQAFHQNESNILIITWNIFQSLWLMRGREQRKV